MFVFNGQQIETDSHGYLKTAMNGPKRWCQYSLNLEEIRTHRATLGNYPFCAPVLFKI